MGWLDYLSNEHDVGWNSCHCGPDNSHTDLGHGLDFRHVYGVQAGIMQHDTDLEVVIALFKSAIDQGYHPNDVEDEVYRQAGVNPGNFSSYDKEYIIERVSALYESAKARKY